jgi:sugar/nucleoside kinase (ribokinase family)
MNLDLLYIGNISLDKIKCLDSNIRYIWGGSALYSALASRLVFPGSIGIYSIVGKDFDLKIFNENNIIFLGKKLNNKKSNVFLIDEKKKKCFLKNKKYLKFPEFNQVIKVKHLHVSFRKGVPIEEIFLSNIEFKYLSIDVMYSSIPYVKKHLINYLKYIDCIFCNKMEYSEIKSVLKENTEIFITNENKYVKYFKNNNIKKYNVPKIKNNDIKSITGAGDTFIGGFLGCYLKSRNKELSIKTAIRISGLSILSYGNLKLLESNKYDRNNVIT